MTKSEVTKKVVERRKERERTREYILQCSLEYNTSNTNVKNSRVADNSFKTKIYQARVVKY